MLLERPWLLYENEVKRKHLICDCCGQAIYYGNYEYEQDDYYQVEDTIICENCIKDYTKKNMQINIQKLLIKRY